MSQSNLLSVACTVVFGTMLSACSVTPAKQELAVIAPKAIDLRIATWNTEHLAYPIDQGCKPRTADELLKLQAYARNLDADIIGLQEIASRDAVNLLFPESQWTIIVSDRPDSESYTCRGSGFTSTQQKVAFAVKKTLNVTAVKHLNEFGLDSRGLRYGLEIDVELDSPENKISRSISVLNLHMKSGCFVDNHSRSDSAACQIFTRQAKLLDDWVEEKEQQDKPYFIVGDFNHRLSAPYNHLTQVLHTDNKENQNTLINTTAQIIGCHPYYPAPIDHIFAGKMNTADWQYKAQVIGFDDLRVDSMLSDHCAIVTDIQKTVLPLSNAVKWQTRSKEYQTLVRGTYQIAQQALTNMSKPDKPWVVMMDLDETILDNSAYQVKLDSTGTRYTSKSWDQWVKSEQATLTPGAAEFIGSVIKEGGKLAFVTNRNANLDAHTWRNLLALYLPLSHDNVCLLGRTQTDIDAIDGQSVFNDKDLRRAQITTGDAACFDSGKSTTNWQEQHVIVMQIGDNIEDFTHVTQEHADVEAVLSELNKTLFLLPHPMYGSW
jgi:predicted secreted acid phosphatase/endonuclease/exonuclease/phosphatase family metal-dependent hydrolase